jgi:hypothetical protein
METDQHPTSGQRGMVAERDLGRITAETGAAQW